LRKGRSLDPKDGGYYKYILQIILSNFSELWLYYNSDGPDDKLVFE